MQPTPPNPPDKEGPFLPRLETQGHPGPALVSYELWEAGCATEIRHASRTRC